MTVVPNRHSHNLPSWPSSFIGRERELAEVKRLVISTRLLTLTGVGGCGKTRLAGATADRLAASPLFEHGSWFIDLAGLSDPLAVPQTIAQVLSVPESHDRQIINSVADFLQHKRCLLILDNCEHLLLACAELAQTLLDADPHLHILATSREPLNVSHETVWLVPSLAVPEAYSPSPLTHLAKSEAIQLFVARASAALPGFALDESNAAAVVQICRRLDGIPLAIELAAARVKLLDVRQIADRVDDRLAIADAWQPDGAAASSDHARRARLELWIVVSARASVVPTAGRVRRWIYARGRRGGMRRRRSRPGAAGGD